MLRTVMFTTALKQREGHGIIDSRAKRRRILYAKRRRILYANRAIPERNYGRRAENGREGSMRRRDREITDMTRIMEIVKGQNTCCVAFQDEPCPYLIPLNYGAQMENGKLALYFHSALEGTKLDRMKEDPNVSFTIIGGSRICLNGEEACKSAAGFDSICGSGIVRILPEEEKKQGLMVLMNHIGAPENMTFSEDSFDDRAVSRVVVWKIMVETVTGKHHD